MKNIKSFSELNEAAKKSVEISYYIISVMSKSGYAGWERCCKKLGLTVEEFDTDDENHPTVDVAAPKECLAYLRKNPDLLYLFINDLDSDLFTWNGKNIDVTVEDGKVITDKEKNK